MKRADCSFTGDAETFEQRRELAANTLGAYGTLVCRGFSVLRVKSNPLPQVSIQESLQGGGRPAGSGVLHGARQSRLSSHRVRRGGGTRSPVQVSLVSTGLFQRVNSGRQIAADR